jgi:hypothetical protein
VRDAAFRKESSSDGKSFSNAARRVAKRVSKAIATNRGPVMRSMKRTTRKSSARSAFDGLSNDVS